MEELAPFLLLARALELSSRACKVFLPRALAYRPQPARAPLPCPEPPSLATNARGRRRRRRTLELVVHQVSFTRSASGGRTSAIDVPPDFVVHLCLHARAESSCLGARLVEAHQLRMRRGVHSNARILFELDLDGARDGDVYLAVHVTPLAYAELDEPPQVQTVFSSAPGLDCATCLEARDVCLAADGVDDDRILTLGAPASVHGALLRALVSVWKAPGAGAGARDARVDIDLADPAASTGFGGRLANTGWSLTVDFNWLAHVPGGSWHRRCAPGVVHRVGRWARPPAMPPAKVRIVRAPAVPPAMAVRWGGREQRVRQGECPVCAVACGAGLVEHCAASHRGLRLIRSEQADVLELRPSAKRTRSGSHGGGDEAGDFAKRTRTRLRKHDWTAHATPWGGAATDEHWRAELERAALDEFKDASREERELMAMVNASGARSPLEACVALVTGDGAAAVHARGLAGCVRAFALYLCAQGKLSEDEALEVVGRLK